MKIFITGIAGFLGSHLADRFIELGHEVIGNDTLIGGDNSQLLGGDGADTLLALGGAAYMSGGAGNDVLLNAYASANSAAKAVTMVGGAGSEAVALINSSETPLWRKIRGHLLDQMKAMKTQLDESKEELQWFVEFPFVPWRGAYPIGLPHMIGGLSGAATGALRALLDAQLPLPEIALVVCATAPWSSELAQEGETRCNTRLMEIYGSTETGQIASD